MTSILLRTFFMVAISIILMCVFVPALFYFFPKAMQHVFFLNFVRFWFVDYHNLAYHGVRYRGRNFYLRERDLSAERSIPDGADPDQPVLGVWHILPASLSSNEELNSASAMELSLDDGSHAVFIYLHGNSFDRSQKNRCELYNLLSSLDFHVLAVDYRGYGDSTGRPDEDGLNADAHALYEYARKQAPSKDIYIWGHSMGTGVAARMVAELSDAGTHPKALVLEAPFNNLRDVVRNHPFSFLLRMLPWFDAAIVDPLIDSGLRMSSDERIKRINCPVLVLHAEDDPIIPIQLAQKLVESAKSADREVTYVEFDGSRDYQHKYIHRAPELPDVLREFLAQGHLQKRSKNRIQQEREGVNVEL